MPWRLFLIDQRRELCLRDTNLYVNGCKKFIYYERHSFHVTEIRSDKQFKKALDVFRDDQLQKYQTVIKTNIANAKKHVHRAERNNRTMQDRTRCDYVNMTYTHLPRTLVEHMVLESSKKLNFFPANHGISKHYSPRMTFHRENIDFDTHCAHAIGEYHFK